jgi:hypothetical protein
MSSVLEEGTVNQLTTFPMLVFGWSRQLSFLFHSFEGEGPAPHVCLVAGECLSPGQARPLILLVGESRALGTGKIWPMGVGT